MVNIVDPVDDSLAQDNLVVNQEANANAWAQCVVSGRVEPGVAISVLKYAIRDKLAAEGVYLRDKVNHSVVRSETFVTPPTSPGSSTPREDSTPGSEDGSGDDVSQVVVGEKDGDAMKPFDEAGRAYLLWQRVKKDQGESLLPSCAEDHVDIILTAPEYGPSPELAPIKANLHFISQRSRAHILEAELVGVDFDCDDKTFESYESTQKSWYAQFLGRAARAAVHAYKKQQRRTIRFVCIQGDPFADDELAKVEKEQFQEDVENEIGVHEPNCDALISLASMSYKEYLALIDEVNILGLNKPVLRDLAHYQLGAVLDEAIKLPFSLGLLENACQTASADCDTLVARRFRSILLELTWYYRRLEDLFDMKQQESCKRHAGQYSAYLTSLHMNDMLQQRVVKSRSRLSMMTESWMA
eukprot:TRINITY_DN26811_c0_g1_i1.p1 TRINITY_DN26811_c0_g1~~TRINITY_DN26811_c0_g1_i1.p1  ORF type:complete len:413 (-),score=51.57 TRINITY_DN26811_c0_g1_i1:205-1443(-)